MVDTFDTLYSHIHERRPSIKDFIKSKVNKRDYSSSNPFSNKEIEKAKNAIKDTKTFAGAIGEYVVLPKLVESEKQKVLKALNRSLENNKDIILIGEIHPFCIHSGLENLAIRNLNKKTGNEPVVFHEAFGDYDEQQIKRFYNKKIKKMPSIGRFLDFITHKDEFQYLDKINNLNLIHMPKDHLKEIYKKVKNDPIIISDIKNTIKGSIKMLDKIPQPTLNNYRVIDQTYSLNGKIIGCDMKNKLDVTKYYKGLKIDEDLLKKNLAILANASDENAIKMRDKEMAKIISENLEKGNLHIGIFGADHIDGVSKHLEKKGIKVEKVKLKPIGYREPYSI